MKKIENGDWGVILSIIATLISVIISDAMPNLWIKMIFIICFATEVIIFLIYLNNDHDDNSKNSHKKVQRTTLIILGLIIIAMLIGAPVFSNGSYKNYLTKIVDFFSADENEEYIKNVSSINQQMEDVDKQINDIKDNIKDISTYLENNDNTNIAKTDSLENNDFWKNKEDQQEIAEIVQVIKDNVDINDTFLDLTTNQYKIELLYKMILSKKQYYYYNCIAAFEIYGIDCEEMAVDEYLLVRWDVETLYAYYKMKNDVLNDIINGNFYSEKTLSFNDYKVTMFQYTDSFDYDGWSMNYKDTSNQGISDSLDRVVMEYYKKFSMNFDE